LCEKAKYLRCLKALAFSKCVRPTYSKRGAFMPLSRSAPHKVSIGGVRLCGTPSILVNEPAIAVSKRHACKRIISISPMSIEMSGIR
jgi:hypothetical protein